MAIYTLFTNMITFFYFFSEEIDSSEVQFQISRNQTIYKGNFILKLVFNP